MTASLDTVLAYWRSPDAQNAPAKYVAPRADVRSAYLVKLVRQHVQPGASILELGCNAGRNLSHLWQAGWTDLHGCELNPDAVALMRQTYPHLANLPVHVGPMEGYLPSLGTTTFDAIITMAVLEHVHPDSEGVFDLIEAHAITLITIEDESFRSWRHFPRRYDAVFGRLGMSQLAVESCRNVPGLGKRFVARVFR